MRIEVRFKDDVAIMSMSGKFLAGGDGPFLRQKVKDLIEAGARKIVIDFAEVPYIDSTGLGFLAGSRVTTQNAGVSLVLAGMNQHVRRILDGVRLTPFFVLADDEAGALKKVNEVIPPDAVRGTPLDKGPKKKRSSAPVE
ncbi:MAG: STAS domain-containing protein [Terriglobia bacterium]